MTERTLRIAKRLFLKAAELSNEELDRQIVEDCRKWLFPPLFREAARELKAYGAERIGTPRYDSKPPAYAEMAFALEGESLVFCLEYDLGWGRPHCFFNRPGKPKNHGFGGGYDIPRAIREFLRARKTATRRGSAKTASILNADGTITPTSDDCGLKFPTLAAAREYLETNFNGHGIIFDKNGEIIRRCRCRHGSNHMVQVTGELDSYTDDYGVVNYRDKQASRKTAGGRTAGYYEDDPADSYDARQARERKKREEIARKLKPDLEKAKRILKQNGATLKPEYADGVYNGWFLPFRVNGKDATFKVDVCSPGIVRYQIRDNFEHLAGVWYDLKKMAAALPASPMFE